MNKIAEFHMKQIERLNQLIREGQDYPIGSQCEPYDIEIEKELTQE